MIREQVLRPFGQTESRDVRPEFVIVPEDLGPKDFRVILEVPLEIRGPHVEVAELSERRRHARRKASVGISVLGVLRNGTIILSR